MKLSFCFCACSSFTNHIFSHIWHIFRLWVWWVGESPCMQHLQLLFIMTPGPSRWQDQDSVLMCRDLCLPRLPSWATPTVTPCNMSSTPRSPSTVRVWLRLMKCPSVLTMFTTWSDLTIFTLFPQQQLPLAELTKQSQKYSSPVFCQQKEPFRNSWTTSLERYLKCLKTFHRQSNGCLTFLMMLADNIVYTILR